MKSRYRRSKRKSRKTRGGVFNGFIFYKVSHDPRPFKFNPMSFIGREDDLKTEFIQTVNLNKTGQTKDIDVLLEPVEIKLNGNLVHKGTIREWSNDEIKKFLKDLVAGDNINIE